MANTTPNIGLIQPVDGAAQWGLSLNDNFGIIDSKIKDSIEIATTQFISAGLYKSPQTGFTVSDSTITTESLKCFFPSLITDTSLSDPDILPGTVNYTLSLNINNPAFDMLQKYKLESISATESGLETFYLENLDNLEIGMTANIYISDGSHNKTYTNIGTIQAIGQQDNTLLITTSIIETEVDINNLKNSYIWFNELINTKYKNFFIGLRTISSNQIIPIITTSASEFNISNGNDIYLGSVVVSYHEDPETEKGEYIFVNNLAIFKPWFCNFSSNNRGIDIANHGILTNGKINFIENNKKSLRPVEQFNWQHEGINFTNEAMPHYRESLVEVDSDNKIQFFKAYDNAIISNDELQLETELDGSKWLNGTTEDVVDDNYYTIQRYCILENGKSVVFYGKQEFTTKDAALSQLPFLQPLNVMVICKEVARIIVQNNDNPDNMIINLMSSESTSNYGFFNDAQFTVYNNEEGSIKFKAQDNQNIYLIPDALKKEYVIGDAAENRSNGILPTSNTFILNVEDGSLSINGIKGAFINNGINDASKIDYFTIDSGTYPLNNPSPATEGWYSLIINKGDVTTDEPFSISPVQKLYENAILIGYLYFDGSGYAKAILAPYMLLTSPSARLNYLYSKISVNGCYGDVNGSNLNIGSGIMNIEGVNYQSLTNTNIKEQIQGQINWTYINKNGLIRDDREDFNYLDKRYYYNNQDIKTPVTQNYYTVQKVLLATDGTWFVSYGTDQYSSYNAAKEHLVDEININNNMMLEIMSLILKNGTQTSAEPIVYYTNKKFLGNIQISTVKPEDIIPHYPTSGDNGFYLYKPGTETQQLTYTWDTSTNSPVAVNIYSNGFGIANIPISTPTSTENNKCIVYNSTNNEFTYEAMATSSELNALKTRVSNLEALISSFVTYSTNAPESGNHIGQIAYTELGSGQYEVKFWNGIKWEKLNTWQ